MTPEVPIAPAAEPMVSICTITYNHAAYIEQCIRSVFAQQTNFNFEMVVGDDSSSDATPAKLKALQAEYGPRLQLQLRPQNLGAVDNFRAALAACRGQYIAILEGDDYWTDSGKLQLQVDFMKANLQCSLCFHPAEYVDEQGRPLGRRHPQSSPAVLTMADVIYTNPVQTCALLCRRTLLATIPESFFKLRLLDWPIVILAVRQGQVHFLDRCMSAYRVHAGGGWTSISPAERYAATLQFYLRLVAEFPDLIPEVERALLRHPTQLAQTIDELRNSLSFRLTAPLRFLGDLAAKLFRKAPQRSGRSAPPTSGTDCVS